jgi:hypothetical protein
MAVAKKQTRSYEGIEPKVEKITEELSCELTPIEWNNRAHELATAHRATEQMKERKKAVMAELNADLKIAEAKENKLSSIVSNNSERRDVTVEVTHDYEKGLVTKRRTDTGEEIEKREMTTMERQSSLYDTVDADQFIEEEREAEREQA